MSTTSENNNHQSVDQPTTESCIDTKRQKLAFRYPRVNLAPVGAEDILKLPMDIIDFSTTEGQMKYKEICNTIEIKQLEKKEEQFLRNTSLYINQLKKERSVLERKHNEKIVELTEGKRKLEIAVAEINEKILETRKNGEHEYRKFLLDEK